jgi:hypothetical protein
MIKIGFIGNSCTGKTTAAFGLIAELKFRKALVGYCTDMARAITFAPQLLDTKPSARLHVLFRQLVAETEQTIRPDADYIVTERTALDWWIYYRWTCENVGEPPSREIENLVRAWVASYDLLFFMSGAGMQYVDDGYRPATTRIRNEVEPLYAEEVAWLAKGIARDLHVIQGSDVRGRRDLVVAAALEALSPLTIRETRR